MTVPNLLAERYASAAMRDIWSPRAKVVRERRLWVAVMEAQQALGVAIPAEAPGAYRAVLEQVDLDSIARRERRLRHDVMARLEEFCALAGCEYLHWGLTSRDVTENVEQAQVRDSLRLLATKAAAATLALARRAEQYAAAPLVGRTHNVPAQVTTVGRRFAAAGEELLRAVERLETLLASYPLRGLKGAVGTQADLLALFDGDEQKVAALEEALAAHLGFDATLGVVGQVYPRSLDFEVVSGLLATAAGPAGFATTLRLMAGAGLASEGFGAEQVGSSAMPHKTNARSCERIGGLTAVLRGHVTMAAELAGSQWNEGDVSCSALRRVVLPDACYALDGLLETFLTVVGELQAFPAAAAQELQHLAPSLASAALLAAAVAAGAPRSAAHSVIGEHARAGAEAARAGRPCDTATTLGADDRFPLDAAAVAEVIADATTPGRAGVQVANFLERAARLAEQYPAAADVRPEPIL